MSVLLAATGTRLVRLAGAILILELGSHAAGDGAQEAAAAGPEREAQVAGARPCTACSGALPMITPATSAATVTILGSGVTI